MTIKYGQTVRYVWLGISISIRRSICLRIQCFNLSSDDSRLQERSQHQSEQGKKYFNTKLAKVRIKSKHCIGILKVQFQCLQGFRWVICIKADLDAILKSTLGACILHNLLIEHPVPPDWFDDNIVELEQEDEIDQSIENNALDTICNQVSAYMLEGHRTG